MTLFLQEYLKNGELYCSTGRQKLPLWMCRYSFWYSIVNSGFHDVGVGKTLVMLTWISKYFYSQSFDSGVPSPQFSCQMVHQIELWKLFKAAR